MTVTQMNRLSQVQGQTVHALSLSDLLLTALLFKADSVSQTQPSSVSSGLQLFL